MKSPQTITDAELAVLKFLWDRESATAKGITERLYPECTASDVGTVHSMLKRLESKRFIHRDRETHPQHFSAAVDRTQLAGRQLDEIANKVSDGSYMPFLTHLVEGDRLSEEDLAELRKILRRRQKSRGQ